MQIHSVLKQLNFIAHVAHEHFLVFHFLFVYHFVALFFFLAIVQGSQSDNLTPLSPKSDLDLILPFNIDTISCRQLIRIKKNINLGIVS